MSAPELPEDLSRWPENSYELLGVPPEIDPRELKRAYTRLIRIWKPEQFPEHFRRIRTAYEIILQRVQFMQQFRQEREAEDHAPTAADPSLSLDETAAPERGPGLAAQESLDLEQRADVQWQRACTGEEADAYAKLVELHQQRPRHPALCIRLYWLLVLTPALDGQRNPCDWLVQGMLGAGLVGGLRELYRREIAHEPTEAMSDRCGRLLHALTQPAQLADLAEWRWPAAVLLGQWRVIDDDLELLHDRLERDEGEAWVRLLITAAIQLSSVGDAKARQLAQECVEQIQKYDHLQQRLTAELDHLEVVMEAAGQIMRLEHQHAALAGLLRLIAQSWTRPFTDLRTPLLQYLASWPANPGKPLRQLDELRSTGSDMVLMQLGGLLALLDNTMPYVNDPRTPQDLETLAGAFLGEHDWRNYDSLRPLLLQFCIREVVPPEAVLNQLGGTALGQWLSADAPLQYVCWACRLVGG